MTPAWFHWAVPVVIGPLAIYSMVRLVLLLPVWRRARRAGLDVTLSEVFGMHLRKSAHKVVAAAERASAEGHRCMLREIEPLILAGADAIACLEAARILKHKRLDANWLESASADLAGVDVIRAADHGISSAAMIVSPNLERFRRMRADGAEPPASRRMEPPPWPGERS